MRSGPSWRRSVACCGCAPANQLLRKVGQAPSSTTNDGPIPSGVPLRVNAEWAMRGLAPARTTSPSPGLSWMSPPTSEAPAPARSSAACVAPVISDVHHRHRGVPRQQADAQRRRRVADDAETGEASSGETVRDHRCRGGVRARGQAQRGCARDAADQVNALTQAQLLAILTWLDHDVRPGRGPVDRRHDRVPRLDHLAESQRGAGGRQMAGRSGEAFHAAEHGYHYQYGEGRAEGPRRPSPAAAGRSHALREVGAEHAQRRDIVLAARLVGRGNQGPDSRLGITGVALHQPRDARRGHQVAQAVAAQDQRRIRLEGDGADLDEVRVAGRMRLGAHIAIDLVAARVPHRLQLADVARVLPFAHRRMIPGDLGDPAAPQLVQAARRRRVRSSRSDPSPPPPSERTPSPATPAAMPRGDGSRCSPS